MPEEKREPGIALAMSGGGYRATLFHVGSLWRLNELGVLSKLARISSVSGGSITAGHLARVWPNLKFKDGVASNYAEIVAAPLMEFCHRDIDLAVVGKGALTPFMSIADFLVRAYRDHLDLGASLQTLSDSGPRFVFNTTNLATGVDFRFSKPYAADYRIGMIENPDFDIATAVAASSAFPPVLSPLKLKVDPKRFKKTPGADLYGQVEYRKELVLSDGGVYDNLGLEPVDRFETILASDAGAPFDLHDDPTSLWHGQVLRALDVAVNQARALRKRMLIGELQRGAKGAYWGIGTDIADYKAPGALAVPPAKIKELAAVRTRLNDFNDQEQGELINWGYAVCDAAMRSHGGVQGPAPKQWPLRRFALTGTA